MTFQTGYTGHFEGWTRLELIQKILMELSQPVATLGTDTSSDYSRYPKQAIIDQLIQAEIAFAKRSKFLKSFAIVEAVADRTFYRLPSNHLTTLAAKYYRSLSDYDELELLSDLNSVKRKSWTWKTDSSGTNIDYYFPGYRAGNNKQFGVYVKPSSDGTTYTGTSMGIVTSATDFSFTGSVTGTHKTGYANSAFLVDADGRDFTTLGVVVGMMIFNTTDGSSGQITAISSQDATNDKISVTLSGGTDDDFDIDDSFVITVGEYGVVIRSNTTQEWAFSSEYGAVQDIWPLTGNFLIDYVRTPLRLDYDTQIPETPYEYQHLLVSYCTWKLGGTEYDGIVQQKRSEEAKAIWFEGLAEFDAINEEAETTNLVEDREGMYFGDITDALGE